MRGMHYLAAVEVVYVFFFFQAEDGIRDGRVTEVQTCALPINIHLVHPENWKRGRKYNSERQWIHTVYHEFGHYVLWADAERKADGFAYRFVRGVSANRAGAASRPVELAASRARRKRAAAVTRPRPRRHPRRARYR